MLLQGPTAGGKTSLVQELARCTGHKCVRVNNHEGTDVQVTLACSRLLQLVTAQRLCSGCPGCVLGVPACLPGWLVTGAARVPRSTQAAM